MDVSLPLPSRLAGRVSFSFSSLTRLSFAFRSQQFEFTTEPVIVPVGAGPNHRSPRTHAHLSALDKLRVVRPVNPEEQSAEESSE